MAFCGLCTRQKKPGYQKNCLISVRCSSIFPCIVEKAWRGLVCSLPGVGGEPRWMCSSQKRCCCGSPAPVTPFLALPIIPLSREKDDMKWPCLIAANPVHWMLIPLSRLSDGIVCNRMFSRTIHSCSSLSANESSNHVFFPSPFVPSKLHSRCPKRLRCDQWHHMPGW